jgi:phosphate starvation-inducible PhoH-like protein
MGRNRKTLGGGKWGEAIMDTVLNSHSQHQQRHSSGGKKIKQKDRNSIPSSYPSSSSPSPYSARNKSKINYRKNGKDEPLYEPRTPNQALYLKYLIDNRVKIVLGVGPAGCGKTLFACHRAIEEFMEGGIQKIVITRPMVSVEDESVGFLPGDMTQKMAPWTRPIFDIFHEYFDPLDVQDMIVKGVIEISPLAYMRGRTFKDAFIIADEMQNSTPNQMLMLTTRLGENSKMAITGDLKQSDKGLENNGLSDFMRKLYTYRRVKNSQSGGEGGVTGGSGNLGVKLVQLCSSDVCRSQIVSRILDMYQVASEVPVSGYLDKSVMELESDMDEEEPEQGRKQGEEGNEKYSRAPKKPYYSPSNEKQISLYQPKPKRYYNPKYQTQDIEYEDDFGKNLKKIIDDTVVEQTAFLKEQEHAVLEAVDESAQTKDVDIILDTSIHTKTDTRETWSKHGSSDCAMIPKKEEERSGNYFRFFS